MEAVTASGCFQRVVNVNTVSTLSPMPKYEVLAEHPKRAY